MKTIWILFGILFLAVNADEQDLVIDRSERLGRAWIDANMNEYMDLCMNEVGPWLVANGMDPMNVPDMMDSFEYKPLLITYHGELYLTNGVVSNLRNIRRDGDSSMGYNDAMMRVRTGVAMESLDLRFDYDANVMDLGPNGWIEGYVENLKIHCDFILDFYDFHIFMQDFRVTNIGYLDIKVKGNILIDWMANIVIKIVTTLFKSTVTEYVSSKIFDLAEATIDDLNRAIKGVGLSSNAEFLQYLKMDVLNELKSFNNEII